jgi:hypothetical protein
MIGYWEKRVQDAQRELVAEGVDLRKHPWKGLPNPLAGACYFASESLAAIMVDQGREVEVYTITHQGAPHWFLRVDGWITDPTAGQFSKPVPYEQGRRIGFLTKRLSKRTRILLQHMGLDTDTLTVYR